jgi:membrane protein implicated in regulation of membrane protease activity
MEQIIYGITIILYAVFIIRFILSWVGGDFDLDMDADGDVDLGDVVSFKGATHFLMGFFSWLSAKLLTAHTIEWYDYIIAFALGVVFFIVLVYIYKLMMKLECKPIILTGKQLIGKSAKVYLHVDYNKYIITVNNGIGTTEVPAHSSSKHNIGDMVTILDYKDSYYIIK